MTIRWNLAGIWLHQVKIGSLVCWSSDRLPAVFYIVPYQNNREHAGDFSRQNMNFFQNLGDTLTHFKFWCREIICLMTQLYGPRKAMWFAQKSRLRSHPCYAKKGIGLIVFPEICVCVHFPIIHQLIRRKVAKRNAYLEARKFLTLPAKF